LASLYLCDIALFLNLYLCDNLRLLALCASVQMMGGSLDVLVDEEDSDWNNVVFLLHDWMAGNENCDVGLYPPYVEE